MLTSRRRVEMALAHQEPDYVPLDLGASHVTGMHVSIVYQLRQTLGLDPPGTPVRVFEPYQMLGEIGLDLVEALGVDVVGLFGPRTMFGFENRGWKPWTTFEGTPVLVPEGFNTEPEPNGDLLMYPEGDRTAPPSGRMPKGGCFFDSIVRQEPIEEEKLTADDNLEEFTPISDADLHHFATEADRLARASDKAILASFGGTAFGDIALVPAPFLKHPKGIRDVAEWYMSTASRTELIHEIFRRQCDVALANLVKLYDAVGDRVTALFVSGTDFGTQCGLFISRRAFCNLYQPYYRRVNDWVHTHTPWKTFIHSCGAVAALIPDFQESGFDILNPVQCSAVGMEPEGLKERFGQQVTFWGGGVDTQRTLPFGTPAEVTAEVERRLAIFARGGGFVFNPIHNVQAKVPMENVLAMYRAVRARRL